MTSDGTVQTFEACWEGEHVVSSVTVDGDEVVLRPVAASEDSPVLVIRLDVFKLLSARTMIAAHSRPGADRG